MITTLIVMIILIIVGDNIIDDMIHSHVARNIFKTALGLIMIQTSGFVSAIAIVGYGVVRSKRAQTAIKNGVHNLLTR
jgi:hypothetical protein